MKGEFRRTRAEVRQQADKLRSRRPARSEQNPAKKFPFPFRRKDRRAQIKKCEENFFAGWRSASWRRAAAGRSVKVRSPDFAQRKFGFRPTRPPNTICRKMIDNVKKIYKE
ncbi:hypothetical protein COY65_02005 [Candidatus Jorgensenbacteria bacterium CG_4_10_14_0_8_um_filter_39_13]|uniref:Uncharacterized protein n=1 Tax=Candidatus Jorgensenbacteria bacterium CG_4_10_14_0_8_um_filter_39_13 TaxID=1974589 RepID=A0A2M7RGK5_9BACT|nr:MAG: hypothetical protein COY65_02005 [Candidatus Jorgensenbacteria bacterium CG_4_10_14_0_8_um_filter_39_13]